MSPREFNMKFSNVYCFLLVLAGCVPASGLNHDYQAALTAVQPRDRLSVRTPKLGTAARYCPGMAVFENQGKFPVEPRIVLLVYDAKGNTLSSERIYFDSILPEKHQEKSFYFQSSCDRIARLYVSESYARAPGGDNMKIIGVPIGLTLTRTSEGQIK